MPSRIVDTVIALTCLTVAGQAATPTCAATGPYKTWLNKDVAYIITDQERAAFTSLRADQECGHFIEQFWLRRDPTPNTAENEFKEEHYRRIAYSNDRFPATGKEGWQTDRGRTYILYGPPDEIDSHPTAQSWLYRRIENIGANVIVEFVDREGSGDYRMTTDPSVAAPAK